ncbi:hypothetical protein J4573_02570 [Actinomadura barringtoniae]|uniref:DUF3592 domain-containing protein n=1 Tax=Actinomadura barringtoniae TaxID=1427535 RepID=A0A939P635_9ACTN|nr:DUF3592 domain-containing protein [Actinomadura barringtoniae]MBO2445963.1 hypothetical protein [Actinomadura barringtoniae]
MAGTWAGVDLADEVELERNGVVAPAKVVSVGWERKDLRVRVEFSTRDGKAARSVLDTNEMGGDDHVPHAGDVIDIRYDPGDPGGSVTKATRGLSSCLRTFSTGPMKKRTRRDAGVRGCCYGAPFVEEVIGGCGGGR